MTNFSVGSGEFGGSYSYKGDPRIDDFFSHIPPAAMAHVLELGSCEGGQTFELIQDPRVIQITGIEGKKWLADRANQVFSLLDFPLHNVNFEHHNLDTGLPFWVRYNNFTSIFCSGLLYHLTEPWKLLKELNEVCDWLYLATHYTNTPNISRGRQRYRGLEVTEPKDPAAWCGITDVAFWFSLPDLIRCLYDTGWKRIYARQWEQWSDDDKAPMISLVCQRIKS